MWEIRWEPLSALVWVSRSVSAWGPHSVPERAPGWEPRWVRESARVKARVKEPESGAQKGTELEARLARVRETEKEQHWETE